MLTSSYFEHASVDCWDIDVEEISICGYAIVA